MDRFDLAILGGGSAGLTGARFAAKLGARVALVEAERIGGDCTFTGCVPSKALIRVAALVHDARRASRFTETSPPERVDLGEVRRHLKTVVEGVHAREAPPVLEREGIRVLSGRGELLGKGRIQVGTRVIEAGRIVVATGAAPRVPNLPGIADVRYLTHRTVFELERLPKHLVILGGGPIGIELAQAYRRLGAAVTVVTEQVLPEEEPEARALAQECLEAEGVRFAIGRARQVRRTAEGIAVEVAGGVAEGDVLLVAVGRAPNVLGLGLAAAGVRHSLDGIEVDRFLRTTAGGIFGAGDVLGGPQFTHLAGSQCFTAVRNALLPGMDRADRTLIPKVTFTSPEIASVGRREADARREDPAVRAHLWELERIDRALCDGESRGFVKLVVEGEKRIVGATVVAARAGEMISELALAIGRGIEIGELAQTMHPYPTWSMALQELAADVATTRFVKSAGGRLVTALRRFQKR